MSRANFGDFGIVKFWSTKFEILAFYRFWETTRLPDQVGMQCLEAGPIWGVNWNEDFMQFYLELANHLSRHEPSHQPKPAVQNIPHDFRDKKLKIAVMSMCDYKPGHLLYQIDKISSANREIYTSLHGYHNAFYASKQSNRHPVWDAIYIPLQFYENSKLLNFAVL